MSHLELSLKLNEREQYFRALTECISDVIFILDPLGTVTYVSQSVQEHLGGRWTDWIDRPLIDVVHPDDRERFARALNAVLSSRSFGPEEFCMRSENGSWRDIEVAATNLLADPQVQGLVFNVRDLTERKKVELMGIQANAEVLRRGLTQNVELHPANDPGQQAGLSVLAIIIAVGQPIRAGSAAARARSRSFDFGARTYK